MVSLGSVLNPRASLPQLLQNVQDLINQNANSDIHLELEVACVDVIALLLMKCDQGGVPSEDALATAAALIQLVWVARGTTKMPHAVQRALVESSIGATLSTLAYNIAQASNGGLVKTCKFLESLAEIADGLGDLAPLKCRGGGAVGGSQEGPKIKGRTLIGPQAIPALTKLLFIKIVPGYDEEALLNLRNAAVTALLAYATTPANCSIFAATDEIAGGKALPSLFEQCGDFPLQVDLVALLYNCAKTIDLDEGLTALPKSPFTSQIMHLAAKSEELNLSSELRSALMTYNRKLGKRAMVTSVQAVNISAGGNDAIAAPGNWVDFGLQNMCLTFNGGEFASTYRETPGSQPIDAVKELNPELVTVLYSNIASAKISCDAGEAVLAITLTSVHDSFNCDEKFPATKDGSYVLRLTFDISDLATLQVNNPKVAAALQAAGVPLQEDEEANPPKRNRARKTSNTGRRRISGMSANVSVHSNMSVFEQVQHHKQKAAASGNAAKSDADGSPGSVLNTGKGGRVQDDSDVEVEEEQEVATKATKSKTAKNGKAAKGKYAAKPSAAAAAAAPGGKKKTAKKLSTRGAKPDAGKAEADGDAEQEYQAPAQTEEANDDGLLDWMTEAAAKHTPEGLRPTQPGALFYDSSDDDDDLGMVPHVPNLPKTQHITPAALDFPGEQQAPARQAPSSTFAHDSLGAYSDDSEDEQEPPPAAATKGKPAAPAAVKRKPALKKTAPKPKAPAPTKPPKATKSKLPTKTTKTTKTTTKAPAKPKATTGGGGGRAAATKAKTAAKPKAAAAAAPFQEELRADSDREWDEDDYGHDYQQDDYYQQRDVLPLTQRFDPSAPLSSLEDLSPKEQQQFQRSTKVTAAAAAPAPVGKRAAAPAAAAGMNSLKALLSGGAKKGDAGSSASDKEGADKKNGHGVRPTPPSSKTAKGPGRLAAMRGKNTVTLPRLGRLSQGDEPLSDAAGTDSEQYGTAKKKAGALRGATGAHLLTITPAVTAAKKRDAGSDPPPPAAAAAIGGGGRGQRVAAATAAAKVRGDLRLEASSEEEEDQVDVYVQKVPAAQRGVQQFGQRSGGKQRLELNGGTQRAFGAAVVPSVAPNKLQSKHKPKVKPSAAAAKKMTPAALAVALGGRTTAKSGKTTAAAAKAAAKTPIDLLPDDDFTVGINSDSEDEEEDDAVGGLAGGNAAALLAMFTGGGGGGGARGNGRRTQNDDSDYSDDSEDEEDDGANTQQLQMVMAEMISKRKRLAAKKKSAASKKLQQRLTTKLKTTEAEIEGETRAAQENATRVQAEACAELEGKFGEIVAVNEQHEVVVTELWDHYGELEADGQAKMQAALHELEAVHRAGKRKLEETTAEIERELTQAQKRMKTAARRAQNVPDIGNILRMMAMAG